MSMLADDFADPRLPLWPGHYGVSVTNGRAEFDLTTQGYRQLDSTYFYDLRDSAFSIEITTTGTMTPSVDFVELMLQHHRQDGRLEILTDGSELVVSTVEGGVRSEPARIPYVPVAHATWRVAEAGGVLRIETAPLGGTFTVIAQLPTPAWVGSMRVVVTAAHLSSSTFGLSVANVNGGTPSGQACHVRYLQDAFSGSASTVQELAEQWARTTAYDCRFVEGGGMLEATLLPNGAQSTFTLAAGALQDLRGGRILVEIPQMVDTETDTQSVSMSIRTLDDDLATLRQQSGKLLWLKTGETQVGSISYSPTMHRWWQIREDGGTIYWESSVDGVSFVELGRIASFAGLDRTNVSLRVYGLTTLPGTASFDNFNLPP